jgi:hypothetical protein
LTAKRLDREEEVKLFARIRRGGKVRDKALTELCESIDPFVSALARKILSRFSALDYDSVKQTLWVHVLVLARNHDPSRSRFLHVVKKYGVRNTQRESSYQEQRAPAHKRDTSGWWSTVRDVDKCFDDGDGCSGARLTQVLIDVGSILRSRECNPKKLPRCVVDDVRAYLRELDNL